MVAKLQPPPNLNDLADVNVPTPGDQYFVYRDAATGLWKCRALVAADIPSLDAAKITTGIFASARVPTNIKLASLTFVIDGGGSAITTGLKMGLEIPFACTIVQATLIGVLPADTNGSIVIDIWKTTYADAPPKDANSITSVAPPTITNAKKSQDSTLTGWTIAIAAGDILFANVDSCSTFTAVTLSLKVTKT